MITILFFAQLREQLQCEKLIFDISTSSMSVEGLRAELIKKNPQWNIFLSNEKLLCAINQSFAKTTATICDGDEVAFFPPVTGG